MSSKSFWGVLVLLIFMIVGDPFYGYTEEPLFPKQSIKHEQTYDPIIQDVSKKYKVDSALIKAIIMVESKFNSKAVSHKGAKGLMQLMPVITKHFKVKNVFDPYQNIKAGTRHIKALLKKFDGNISYAIAAYNAGGACVRKYKGIPPYEETIKYVDKVNFYYVIYKMKEGEW